MIRPITLCVAGAPELTFVGGVPIFFRYGKGKLGMELTVDLGFNADNAKDLRIEEAVAHELLTRLPG